MKFKSAATGLNTRLNIRLNDAGVTAIAARVREQRRRAAWLYPEWSQADRNRIPVMLSVAEAAAVVEALERANAALLRLSPNFGVGRVSGG